MKSPSNIFIACAALGAACALASPHAGANMILGYQLTGPGNLTGAGTVNSPPQPGSTFYGDTFTAPTPRITGSAYGFCDDFIFSVANGTVDSLTSSINLGALLSISDLALANAFTGSQPRQPQR